MRMWRSAALALVIVQAFAVPCFADYGSEVSADNPMAWWRFEDASSSSGSTAADSVGAHDGTYNGDVVHREGIAGSSARFDGSFDYIDVGSMGALPIQGSIEFWIWPDVVENYRNAFTTGPLTGATAGNHAIRFEENTGALRLYIGDDVGTSPDYGVTLRENIDEDTWIHVVLTWDTAAGVLSGFLDGEIVVDEASNTFWPSQLSNVVIGMGFDWAVNRCFEGNIDEVAIYDSRLSAARVRAHYLAGSTDKLKASDADPWDIFGFSVDLSGDTAVVGAHGNDDHGTNSGSAYIFERDAAAGFWSETTKLTASDAGAVDNFGYAVAISGDIAVISALYDDEGAVDAGAAYVFYRDQGGTDAWGEVTKLVASDAGFEDLFGNEVDVDGTTIVVGTLQADGVATDSGKAYVFEKDAGGPDNWGQVKILEASDAAADLRLGASVGLSGDTIVVGAKGDASAGLDTGAAYVFERDLGGSNNWGQMTKLVAADAAAGANFGQSSSIDGDLILVGAFLDDSAAVDSGSAYVFERDLGGLDGWGQRAKLVPADGAFEDKAALSVSIHGSAAVIGAGMHDAAAEDAGAVYVFERNRNGADAWGQVIKWTAPDAGVEDYLAHGELAVDGDRILVGAYADDGPRGSNEGSVHIFGVPLFADGFETGLTPWDIVVP